MARSYQAQTNQNGITYITAHGSDEPVGPIDMSNPVNFFFGLLMLLIGFAIIVMAVLAANAPNPGEPGYVSPGSNHSTSQEG